MPSAAAVFATRRPMLPTPMIPRVLPLSSTKPCQRPLPQSAFRVRWSTTTACLAQASISMMACSATELELEPGACTTATPRSVAAGKSTMSRPTPWRPTTFRRGQAAIRPRVQSGLERKRIPSASWAAATMPASVSASVTTTRASASSWAMPSGWMGPPSTTSGFTARIIAERGSPRHVGHPGGGTTHAGPAGMSSITTLRREAATCTACPLYRHATQTVFGEGDAHAAIVLVGEQPGNDEDLAGRPFVGPAGRLLDRALERAGLERSSLYVTNAVKHFKWSKDRGGGKRRIHEKPSASEVEACRPWLEQELWLIRPQVVVCLGATAARSVLARAVTITASRGRPLTSPEGYRTLVTVHPSALLRIPDPGDREDAEERFVADLRAAGRSARHAIRADDEKTTR